MHTVANRYVLEERLGVGGMGEVYRARHLQLGKSFALKVIAPAFAGDAALRARFEHEAQLASEIDHPNIVSVVDFGEDPVIGAFMVMELVHGASLLEVVNHELREQPSVRRAVDILGQVCDALDHVHQRGIIHGDVKAENIMLADEPAGGGSPRRRRLVRLLDFGLARRLGPTDEAISGSPHYVAPERALGGPATVATDIYALGVLAFLLFTHTLPFDGEMEEVLDAHVRFAAPTLSERRGERIDDAIETLVARAMAKSPDERHASARKFRYELNTVMDMLDIRRRSSGAIRTVDAAAAGGLPRETAIGAAFERSRMPQALCGQDGVIVYANKAFCAFVGDPQVEGKPLAGTTLAAAVGSLVAALPQVHETRKSCERRAWVKREGRTSLEVTVWVSPLPLPGMELHLVVRVDEIGTA